MYVHVVLCLVTQSCPTLCNPIDCSLPGSSDHGDSPGKNTGVSCHACLQGIFLTQELNQGLLHCRQIPYQLSNQGSPRHKKETNRQLHNYKFNTSSKIRHLLSPLLDLFRICILFQTFCDMVSDFYQALSSMFQLFSFRKASLRPIKLLQCCFDRPHPLFTLK